MKLRILLISAVILIASCKPTSQVASSNSDSDDSFKKFLTVTGVSNDAKYGVSEKNAIKVGGRSPANERAYLDQLAGPNGEAITYQRTQSCCPFDSPNALFGQGLLDVYLVSWKGGKVKIYINMYDPPKEHLLAPKGLTVKK